MKKSTVLKTLTLVLAIALCALLLAACVPEPEPTPQNNAYPIPEDLVINVEIYEGATLLGTITESALEGIAQEIVTMTTTNSMGTEKTESYVAYSISAILNKLGITLPAVTSVKTEATDAYVSSFDITSLAASYLTIGFEEDGAFVEDTKTKNNKVVMQAPRFILDKTSVSSNDVTKMVARIIVNPTAPYEIPENLDVDVEIYEGATLLGTVSNATLEAVFQQIVTITTVKDEVETTSAYVSYSMNDIFHELDIALPQAITSVNVVATDEYETNFLITSLDAAYLTIGFEDDGEFAEDIKTKNNTVTVQAPRFISDKASASSNSVTKMVAKIIINPAA